MIKSSYNYSDPPPLEVRYDERGRPFYGKRGFFTEVSGEGSRFVKPDSERVVVAKEQYRVRLEEIKSAESKQQVILDFLCNAKNGLTTYDIKNRLVAKYGVNITLRRICQYLKKSKKEGMAETIGFKSGAPVWYHACYAERARIEWERDEKRLEKLSQGRARYHKRKAMEAERAKRQEPTASSNTVD